MTGRRTTPDAAGVIATTEERTRERFDASAFDGLSWFTLISGDLAPTNSMSAGVMELEPDGTGLRPHRHAPAEIYHVLAGSGLLTIDGAATPVAEGATAFIPGHAEHSLRNTGSGVMRVFYVFPTDRFSDVVYEYPPYAVPRP